MLVPIPSWFLPSAPWPARAFLFVALLLAPGVLGALLAGAMGLRGADAGWVTAAVWAAGVAAIAYLGPRLTRSR